MTFSAITKNQNILGGVPVFRSTCVPFQSLFGYLEAGQRLDDFLDDVPTVSREVAISVLKEAGALVVAQLK